MFKYKNAGRNIKTLLTSKDMTQEQLANKLGITPTSLCNKLNSSAPKWKLNEAVIISEIFNLTMEQIFLGETLPFGKY